MLQKLSLSIILLLTTAWLVSMSFAGIIFTDVTKEAGVGDKGSGVAFPPVSLLEYESATFNLNNHNL